MKERCPIDYLLKRPPNRSQRSGGENPRQRGDEETGETNRMRCLGGLGGSPQAATYRGGKPSAWAHPHPCCKSVTRGKL